MRLPFFYSIMDVKAGDHLCYLYDSEEQLWNLLVPFIKKGLESQERVLYIAEASAFQSIGKYLRHSGTMIAEYVTRGQLIFLSYERSFLRNGIFQPNAVLDFLKQITQESLSQGYQAVRIAAKMDWARAYTKEVIEYEARLNYFIADNPIMFLCKYNIKQFEASILMEILHTHPLILLGAELIENVYYIPPSEFFNASRTARILQHRLRLLWEHRQVEKALRDSEERLNEAQNIAHIGSWDLDLRSNHLILSPEIYRILEIEPSHIPNTSDLFIRMVHPEDQRKLAQTYEASIRDKTSYEVVHRLMMSDGRLKFVQQRFKTFYSQYGEPLRSIGTVQDITERKKAEDRETARKAILQLLVQGVPLPGILEQIAKMVERENPCALCSILLLDHQERYLLHGTGPSLPAHYNQAINGFEIGPYAGSCGTAAYTKKRVIVSDIAGNPLWHKFGELALQCGLRSCWSEPIFASNGKVLGTFAIYHREPKLPKEDEIKFIEATANFVSIAIERKRGEEILQEREASYRTLAQNLPGIVYRVFLQENYKIQFFNDMLMNITGFSAEELKQGEICSLEHLILSEDRPKVVQKIRWAIEHDQAFEIEYRLIHKNGTIRYLNERGRSIRNQEGKPYYIDGVIFDVTERHKADEKLKELYEQAKQDDITKSELLREVNHRVKNNLIAILGLLLAEQRYAPTLGKPFVTTAIENVSNRIKGLIEAHQLLCESQWAPMPLSMLISRIIGGVTSTLPAECNITVDIMPSSLEVSPRQASNLALVINELAANTIKYALGNRQTAHILVRMGQEGDKIYIIYQDDGPGYPDEVIRMERYNVGIRLLQELVTGTLRGTLKLSNQNGATAILYIQKEKKEST